MSGLHSGEFAAPSHATHIDVHPHWPAKDEQGGDYTPQGAHIELLRPGSCKWERAGWIPFPFDTGKVEVTEDGEYGVRVIIMGSCRESQPSEGTSIVVNVLPPAKPQAPTIITPCPARAGAFTLTQTAFCYPDKDTQGGRLLSRSGMIVQSAAPGSHEWINRAQVKFPEMTANIELFGDGAHRVRVIAVGACNRSEPSDPVAVHINNQAPARPDAPEVVTPCPISEQH